MIMKRRKLLQLGFATALTGMTCPPVWARVKDVEVTTGPAFGSFWRIIMADTKEDPRRLIDNIVRSIDMRMSPFSTDSDLGRFNAGEAIVVDFRWRVLSD